MRSEQWKVRVSYLLLGLSIIFLLMCVVTLISFVITFFEAIGQPYSSSTTRHLSGWAFVSLSFWIFANVCAQQAGRLIQQIGEKG